MEVLSPAAFFELSQFSHKELFHNCDAVWKVLTRLKTYLESLRLGQIEVAIPDGVYLVDPHLVSIGEGTVIEPGAYIKGPCIIGKNCTVRHGAYIRGTVIAGDRCILGHCSEFKNALLLDDAKAAHFAYVGDTILGSRVNLGAGTICANQRLNKKPVDLVVSGEKIATGLKKCGAIIGDDAQTGCHAVLNPGTLMGKQAFCYPNVNVGGFFPAGSVIR